jgi:hypothetical protein
MTLNFVDFVTLLRQKLHFLRPSLHHENGRGSSLESALERRRDNEIFEIFWRFNCGSGVQSNDEGPAQKGPTAGHLREYDMRLNNVVKARILSLHAT